MTTPRELGGRRRWMTQAQRCDLAQFIGERFNVETAHCFQLRVRRAACANKICVIRIRKTVRISANRSEDGALFEDKNGVRCAGGDKRVGDRLDTLCICDRVPPAIEDAQVGALARPEVCKKTRALDLRGPDLEMWITRAAQRPGREERAAEVRAPAAPPRNHATRRPLDRAMRRIEHACTVERLVRMPGAFDVELITSRPAERMLLVRP